MASASRAGAVLKRAVPGELKGHLALEFAPERLRYSLRARLATSPPSRRAGRQIQLAEAARTGAPARSERGNAEGPPWPDAAKRLAWMQPAERVGGKSDIRATAQVHDSHLTWEILGAMSV